MWWKWGEIVKKFEWENNIKGSKPVGNVVIQRKSAFSDLVWIEILLKIWYALNGKWHYMNKYCDLTYKEYWQFNFRCLIFDEESKEGPEWIKYLIILWRSILEKDCF